LDAGRRERHPDDLGRARAARREAGEELPVPDPKRESVTITQTTGRRCSACHDARLS
jgi:hypothetical protein